MKMMTLMKMITMIEEYDDDNEIISKSKGLKNELN